MGKGGEINNLVVGNGSCISAGGSSVYEGGIAGDVYKSIISGCYNTGNVEASDARCCCAGGIVGSVDGGIISVCNNTGNVSAVASGDSSDGFTHEGAIAGVALNATVIRYQGSRQANKCILV